MLKDPVIFREYDIRGIFEKQFDLEFSKSLGKALVSYIFQKTGEKNPYISVGHDARLSSPAIYEHLIQGIIESGGNVIKLGLIPTPLSYFSTFTLSPLHGAFIITGSHNPPDYNGFKISVGKTTIYGKEIKQLEAIIEEKNFLTGNGQIETCDIRKLYIKRYSEEFKGIDNINVVLDCGNGAAGSVVRDLYESIGLRPEILFEKPDGHFPNHHPDPTVEKNLEDLKNTVRKKKAAIGIGFDGDADRIGAVDEHGNMIYGDELLTLFSRYVLKEHPHQKIIGDVKCSDRLFDDIKKHNGIPIMWKTGHSLIKVKVKEEKAPLGGEMSGHIFFADRNYGYDDAIYASLRLVEILSKTKSTFRELLSDFPKAFNTPEIRIDTTEEKKYKIVEEIIKKFKDNKNVKINLIDGVRISFPDGWALVRASNTQPVIVLRFEASSQKDLDKIRSQIEPTVKSML